VEQHLGTGVRVVGRRRRALRKRLAPYGLAAPGSLWLLLFFVVPLFFMASLSLQTGNLLDGFRLTWHFANFTEALRLYHVQFLRSLVYGAVATAAALVVAYPLAYWIAFRGGRHKNTLLFLILLPFLVSFVIRTLSWQFILSSQGIVLGTLKNLHLVPQDYNVLATSTAVVAGIAYNYLPFMVLPLYVALERIDRNVVEAARDLYSTNRAVFSHVILPLSIPGVFAGVLLTFVPAVGDFVNAALLGGPGNTMIGNIIQLKYLQDFDYPIASALSLLLMLVLIIGIVLYARLLGTRQIEEYM
jgi:spermidine/putrescine transport system permease protein